LPPPFVFFRLPGNPFYPLKRIMGHRGLSQLDDGNRKGLATLSLTAAMPEDDRTLLLGIMQGDRAAFALAMERYSHMVYSLANGILGDQADAEDVSQEVFLRLYQATSRLRADGSLRHWLARTCVNCCWDELRRRTRRGRARGASVLELLPSASPDPDQVTLGREFADAVRACLLQLPPRQRAVFALKHFAGLTIKEIAQLLGCAPGTVKSHLSRAVGALRDAVPVEPDQKGSRRFSDESLP
jgi:RNA polymerase sigma-70 factor (ECF subfamily)